MELDELLKDWDRNDGASSETIRNAELSLGLELPADYKAFLNRANGGVGQIGSNYLSLYRVEDLKQRNEAYEVFQYVPGILLIGSNGGGDGYVFDLRTWPWAVGDVPFIGMELTYLRTLAPSFTEFLEGLARD